MADLITELAGFLDVATRTGFAWGRSDCCLFAADWVLLRTGIDGAARWRGRYSTEQECHALLERDGGVLGVMSLGAAEAGLTETDHPSAGAIGVVQTVTPRGLEQVGAIRTRIGWAVLTRRGVIVAAASHLKAWEI